jgi:hypothetical protein
MMYLNKTVPEVKEVLPQIVEALSPAGTPISQIKGMCEQLKTDWKNSNAKKRKDRRY